MPDLPKKKVGIITCSGEEIPEGTVTRLAALKVLEQLRPADTVTICMPLFLAGGEGDRAFARFYPTIAIDGCKLACAAKMVQQSGGTIAQEFAVLDVYRRYKELKPQGIAELNEAGLKLARVLAEEVAVVVDNLITEKQGGKNA